jgi:uncharacterized membrane protein YidH (DUF202 family)
MSDPTIQDHAPADPGDRPPPGERRLARPPSDRYAPEPAAAEPPPRGSVVRAAAWGDLAGLAGAAAIVVLAGVFAIGAGLLAVAVAVGRFVGLAVREGGGEQVPPRVSVALAIVIALVSVGLGQLGTWLYARSEGGVLELADYLGQTFGWLVPAQFASAAIVAWWSAR